MLFIIYGLTFECSKKMTGRFKQHVKDSVCEITGFKDNQGKWLKIILHEFVPIFLYKFTLRKMDKK